VESKPVCPIVTVMASVSTPVVFVPTDGSVKTAPKTRSMCHARTIALITAVVELSTIMSGVSVSMGGKAADAKSALHTTNARMIAQLMEIV